MNEYIFKIESKSKFIKSRETKIIAQDIESALNMLSTDEKKKIINFNVIYHR